MADIVSVDVRSRMMSGIRSRDTKPEIFLRRALHARGFRYKLHDRSLPGTPDMVFPKWKAVIFVNGCFWHAHDCPSFRWPKTREDFWRQKIGRNVANDESHKLRLREQGWRIGIVWECAIKNRIRKGQIAGEISSWLREGNNEMIWDAA
jgi:DNA mismatch endonuclease, patch repair protein